MPQALAIGISEGEFWNGNPRKLRPYVLAEDIRFKRKNEEYHLLGQYVFEAIETNLYNLHRKSGERYSRYRKEPYKFLSREEAEAEQEKQQKIGMEREKAEFMAFAESVKKRLEHG